MSSNISIKRFEGERPDDNITYFNNSNTSDEIAVVIPFYNEESHELQTSLKSLYATYDYLCEMKKEYREKHLHILIVQDGWYKASESMKSYLKKMYPKKFNGVDWWNYFKEFSKYSKDEDGSITYILENSDYTDFTPDQIHSFDKLFLKISLVIKIDNRRKHNSHEWYMAKTGFAQASKAKYLFFTDAFTLFGQSCLYHLVNKLDLDDNCSSATGRQRVMTRIQQDTNENVFSLGYLLRMVQLYDFESANAVYNGAFSLGGCLPVIPGPCGLYRSSDILQDKVRDWYFDTINEDTTDMVIGNLKIAEDRILTYASVLKTEEERYMAFVPLSVFYFEGELDLKKLILQRRRWINGSVAGYIYLLITNGKHIRNWNTNFFRKFYIWFLLSCQLLIFSAVAISPAYSLGMLYYSITYLCGVYGYISPIIGYVVAGVGWFIFLLHIIVHSRVSYNKIIMTLLLTLSFITTIFSAIAIGYYVFVNNLSFIQFMIETGYIMWLTIIVFFGPFLLALYLSLKGHSFWLMIRAFIPYVLFIHMLISWFGSYSFSRLWDMSWGNRPAGEMSTEEKIAIEKRKKRYKIYNAFFITFIFILNIVIFLIPRYIQLIILSVFFGSGIIQMIFSLIYMTIQIPSKFNYAKKILELEDSDLEFEDSESCENFEKDPDLDSEACDDIQDVNCVKLYIESEEDGL